METDDNKVLPSVEILEHDSVGSGVLIYMNEMLC